MKTLLQKALLYFLIPFRWPGKKKEQGMMLSRPGMSKDEFVMAFKTELTRLLAGELWEQIVSESSLPSGKFLPSLQDSLVDDYGLVGTDVANMAHELAAKAGLVIHPRPEKDLLVITLKDLILTVASFENEDTSGRSQFDDENND